MQRSGIIHKTPADLAVAPNLADHAATCAAFSWETARQALAGLPGGGLNIAYEAVERHAQGPLHDRTAFRFLGDESVRDVSFGELARLTSRFANVLRALGVQRGERVFVLTGRIPELYVAVLGGLKAGCVVSPLFSAFGPEPIATRLNIGEGVVLVTTDGLYARKVAKLRDTLPTLRHVLVVDEEGTTAGLAGTQDLAALMAQAA